MKKYALYLAWLVSLLGVCAALLYGEIWGHPPCALCWYQRICLFPLAILLGMAVYRAEGKIVIYALPLAFLGAFFALIHLLHPYISLLQKSNICKMGVPCDQPGLSSFFPYFSLAGFLIIAFLLLVVKKSAKR